MNKNVEKQWYITTEKGTIKVSRKLPLEQAQDMAMLNSMTNGKTELYDEERLSRYIFLNGRLVKGAVRVASTSKKSIELIRDKRKRVSGSPNL